MCLGLKNTSEWKKTKKIQWDKTLLIQNFFESNFIEGMACFEEKRLAPAEGFSQGFLLSIKPKKYTLQKKIIERIFCFSFVTMIH